MRAGVITDFFSPPPCPRWRWVGDGYQREREGTTKEDGLLTFRRHCARRRRLGR